MKSLAVQLQRIKRIMAISHELVANSSRDDILHHIVQAATDFVDCETAGILLLDESSSYLRFVAATQHKEQLFNIPVPIDASIAGAAFSSNQPVIVHDVQADPRYYPKVAETLEYRTRSLLAVPLTFQGRKIGVLEAQNKRGKQHFDQADAEMLAVLAAHATMSIENARLFEQYKQLAQVEHSQRQMAEALRLAGAVLSSSLDYDQVIDLILEQVSQVIPGDTSNVMMIEDGDIARVFRGHGYEQIGTAETLNSTTLNIATVAGLRQMRETQQPMVIPDTAQDPDWVYSRPEHRWIRSYIGAPISVRGQVVGFLNAMSATPNLYNETHAKRLEAFTHHAASAIDNARLYHHAQEEIAERIRVEEELRHHRDHLEELVKERTAEIHRLAITDSLTGLFNRHHLIELGNQAVRHAQRYQRPLSVMMIDIDHFKKINDTYGHSMGDLALRQVAELMRSSLRSCDIFGRYGGEEFVVLMPETNLPIALQIAERLLANIRALRIDSGKDQFGFTASIGLIECEANQTLEALISHADQAMYAAKQSGRDRVCTQPEKL